MACVTKKLCGFKRAENRVARVRIDRPQPLRLLLREPKTWHLKKLASNNLEQTDEVNFAARTVYGND